MPCSNCGGVLPAGANNCPGCGVAAPPQTVAQMQAAAQYAPPPGQAISPYSQSPMAAEPTAWKWGYSRWIGITYGPVPVGVIVVIVGYFIYYSTRH